MSGSDVCVIIAVRNGQGTIGRAIASALCESLVTEVVVVDDASTDETRLAAAKSDDGTGRLRVISLPTNVGPSAARNQAIAQSSAPFIALLDADDCYLQGRFEDLFALGDWDFAADNIAFVPETASAGDMANVPRLEHSSFTLNFADFAIGNLSASSRRRRQLGFLKPLMRREFLNHHSLHYNENLRLGEDFILYASALAAGAHFTVTSRCGYVAVEREGSLSSRHTGQDLKNLHMADLALLSSVDLDELSRQALVRHAADVAQKYALRRFLQSKAERGLLAAAGDVFGEPAHIWPVASGVARDKFHAFTRRTTWLRPKAAAADVRFLLDGSLFAAVKE